MRVLKEASLFFREGNSDKVYELELLEVGAGECVVNFRYGRRGTVLREGTKTIFPLPFAEADKAYEKLLKEKLDKGYLPATGLDNAVAAGTGTSKVDNEQKDKVLDYLGLAATANWQEEQWKLSRLVWRAGELKLKAAEPFLLKIPLKKEEEFLYSLAWALGRCAGELATDRLMELRRQTDPSIARIATVALSKIGAAEAKESLYRELWGRLPAALRNALERRDATELQHALEELLYKLRSAQVDFLFNLYLLSGKYPLVPQVLLQVLLDLPYKPPYFQQIRYLLKASELLEDAEMWGLLNARFDKGEAYFINRGWGGGAVVEGQYIANIGAELRKEDAKAAYSDKTRKYLQKRAIRMVVRMGEAADKKFTAFARALLLNFSDADDRGKGQTSTYIYNPVTRNYHLALVHFPSFSEYPLLNVLLYRNSARFEMPAKQLRLRYRLSQEPGTATPAEREEAFPALWNAAPEELQRLLQETVCKPVNEFAVKAFRANPARKQYTTATLVKTLLNKQYTESNALGIELAREVYNPEQPDMELLFALLDSKLEEGQRLGLSWLEAARQQILNEQPFIRRLILARQPQVSQWVKVNLSTHLMSLSAARLLAAEVLQELLKQEASEQEPEAQHAYITQVADLLLILFPDALKELPMQLVEQLVAHPLEAVQALGVKILLRHRTRAEDLPDSLFEALLSSPFAPVRALGVNLFGQLSAYALYERRDVLINFCISRHPEVRRQVIPIVAKLVQHRSSFGKELLQLLLPLFWQKENHEGIHADLLGLFQQSLSAFYRDIPEEAVWKLVEAKFRPGQLLGAELLAQHVKLEQVPLHKIAALADHELLSLRQMAWTYFETHVEQARYDREASLKLLDAQWDDSLLFAKRYLEENFRSQDWTPALLVSICDHKREEVQQFGLRLITKHFSEEDGVEYMIKLSQHPNTKLQLFVSNYLNQYATGHTDRIEALAYYFTAVLSQVNKGRVAKARVYDFLRREALASEAVARWALPLLTRISLTMAIGDKANCIQLLTELKEHYPALESPVFIKELKTL